MNKNFSKKNKIIIISSISIVLLGILMLSLFGAGITGNMTYSNDGIWGWRINKTISADDDFQLAQLDEDIVYLEERTIPEGDKYGNYLYYCKPFYAPTHRSKFTSLDSRLGMMSMWGTCGFTWNSYFSGDMRFYYDEESNEMNYIGTCEALGLGYTTYRYDQYSAGRYNNLPAQIECYKYIDSKIVTFLAPTSTGTFSDYDDFGRGYNIKDVADICGYPEGHALFKPTSINGNGIDELSYISGECYHIDKTRYIRD